MPVVQLAGERGSLKRIQRAVAERWDDLEALPVERLPAACALDWLSPLVDDDDAGHRDE